MEKICKECGGLWEFFWPCCDLCIRCHVKTDCPERIYRLYRLDFFVTPMGRAGTTWYWKESGKCGIFDFYSDNEEIRPKGEFKSKHPFPPSNVIAAVRRKIQEQ